MIGKINKLNAKENAQNRIDGGKSKEVIDQKNFLNKGQPEALPGNARF